MSKADFEQLFRDLGGEPLCTLELTCPGRILVINGGAQVCESELYFRAPVGISVEVFTPNECLRELAGSRRRFSRVESERDELARAAYRGWVSAGVLLAALVMVAVYWWI